jgi:hypothetical protein
MAKSCGVAFELLQSIGGYKCPYNSCQKMALTMKIIPNARPQQNVND